MRRHGGNRLDSHVPIFVGVKFADAANQEMSRRNSELKLSASLLLRPQFPWAYEELGAEFPLSAHGRFLFDALRPGRYAASVEVGARDGGVRTIALPPLDLVQDLERDFEVDLEDG